MAKLQEVAGVITAAVGVASVSVSLLKNARDQRNTREALEYQRRAVEVQEAELRHSFGKSALKKGKDAAGDRRDARRWRNVALVAGGVASLLFISSDPSSDGTSDGLPPQSSTSTTGMPIAQPDTLIDNLLCPTRAELVEVQQMPGAGMVFDEPSLPVDATFIILQMRVVSSGNASRELLITICQDRAGGQWYFSRWTRHERYIENPDWHGLFARAGAEPGGTAFTATHKFTNQSVTYSVHFGGVTAVNAVTGEQVASFVRTNVLCAEPQSLPRALASASSQLTTSTCEPGTPVPWTPQGE